MPDAKLRGEPGRVALITGGRRGLGLASAEALAAKGFDIAICDLDEESTAAGQIADIVEPHGVRSLYCRLDIADLDAHDAVLAEITGRLGPIDCLVDNAGISVRPLTDLLDVLPVDFDRVVDVNLRGTFFLTQRVARQMITSEAPNRRSIIVVTSVAAEVPSLNRAQYCLTKASLSMLVKLFAAKLAAHGVDVHEIRPGFMQTEMTASEGAPALDAAIASGRVPIPRWGLPEDVGAAVAALASGQLPYMTGQPLWIAGGINIPRAL